MANKLVALFLMCIVVVAAFSLHEATPLQADDAKFESCFNTCKKECLDKENGETFCETKCSNECGDKEHAGNSF
jgi:hypothetical protein